MRMLQREDFDARIRCFVYSAFILMLAAVLSAYIAAVSLHHVIVLKKEISSIRQELATHKFQLDHLEALTVTKDLSTNWSTSINQINEFLGKRLHQREKWQEEKMKLRGRRSLPEQEFLHLQVMHTFGPSPAPPQPDRMDSISFSVMSMKSEEASNSKEEVSPLFVSGLSVDIKPRLKLEPTISGLEHDNTSQHSVTLTPTLASTSVSIQKLEDGGGVHDEVVTEKQSFMQLIAVHDQRPLLKVNDCLKYMHGRPQSTCRVERRSVSNENSKQETTVPWILSLKNGNALVKKDNNILIKEAGYFLVYSQVWYKDNSFTMGHFIQRRKANSVGSEPRTVILFRCIQNMSACCPNDTCFTAGIAKLEVGDELELIIPRIQAQIALKGDGTFWGAIQLL